MNDSEVRRLLCEMLGAPASSTEDEIKKAYGVEVKKWHPDRVQHNPDLAKLAEQKLKDINQAYECLTDRAQFDKYAEKLAQKYVDSKSSASSSNSARQGSTPESSASKSFSEAPQSSNSPSQSSAQDKAGVAKIFLGAGIFVVIVIIIANVTAPRHEPHSQGITLSPQDSPAAPLLHSSYSTYPADRVNLPSDNSASAPPGSQ